jgi:hypothetical protein
MDTTAVNVSNLCITIAELLGDQWQPAPAGYGEPSRLCAIARPDGVRFHVYLQDDRLNIGPAYARDQDGKSCEHYDAHTRVSRITVNPDAPASTVFSHIRRRFLPAYVPEALEAIRRASQSNDYIDNTAATEKLVPELRRLLSRLDGHASQATASNNTIRATITLNATTFIRALTLALEEQQQLTTETANA